VLFRSIGF